MQRYLFLVTFEIKAEISYCAYDDGDGIDWVLRVSGGVDVGGRDDRSYVLATRKGRRVFGTFGRCGTLTTM
jgi:hypothetical protein